MIGQVALMLLMTSTVVMAIPFDWTMCMNQYNALCNTACKGSRQICHLHTWHNVCPCVIKCHLDHCMEGLIGEVCPTCAVDIAHCKLWHHRIELHSCGGRRFNSETELKSHCQSLDACVRSCPQAARCIGSDIQIPSIPMPEMEIQFK